MLKIINIKSAKNSEGEEFYGLIVQSGPMAIRSKKTGRLYFTNKKAFVPCTFDQETAVSMIGQEIEGSIRKVQTDPYEFTIEETGEIIELNHRYEYFDPALEMEEQVVEEITVI
ncbi:hypothetical protein [Aestuariibaculum suncheonense]|uniref:Uncharacterized protein n=1 Tax=Aestuariibaculum suncheonense TaxID=1028745 RepID=A0A8J6UFR4_9FLAO|nr:hypothetical protein [Aestuariibaculum suncheonense]MBD0834464.1 hypothetical protein [Aestuariibaculum suncheonense]